MSWKALLGALALAIVPFTSADAFCGFYVARADTKLFNDASKVVMARDGDRTVMTMASDYQGSPSEFAMVIPVPTVITRGQVNVAEPALVDHLDAYTAPRLVEYFDEDPCRRMMTERAMAAAPRAGAVTTDIPWETRARALGVTIEAQYQVGEYDILVLSATQSGGLTTWLREQQYRIPAGAEPVIASYLRQNMKFFVAKVNLQRHSAGGRTFLRPLQVAYESPKFMLPIRLGTVNARGPQEVFAFVLTRTGRVESTNYRTVKLPSNLDVPIFVKSEFPQFYRAMFDTAVQRENGRAVFLEYAWDMSWCDPCAADPLTPAQLRQLGAMWLEPGDDGPQPGPPIMRPQPRRVPQQGGAVDVFVTRLHVRYDRDTFPEDLVLQTTGDRENFQGRYVLRHAYTGPSRCPEMSEYQTSLTKRWDKEARTLANLTGWSLESIRSKMRMDGRRDTLDGGPSTGEKPWWEKMWGGNGGPQKR
jgi:hypothetical protein